MMLRVIRFLGLTAAVLLLLTVGAHAQTLPEEYADVLAAWQAGGVPMGTQDVQVSLDSFVATGSDAHLQRVHGRPAVLWEQAGGQVQFTAKVPAAGLYQIQVEYAMAESTSGIIERGLTINGEQQYAQFMNFLFSKQYHDETYPFEKNEYKNDVLPRQSPVYTYATTLLRDREGMYDGPLLFYFQAGENTMTLHALKGGMAIAAITLKAPRTPPGYAAYGAAAGAGDASGVLLTIEAENIFMRSGKNIQNLSMSEPGVTPEALGYKSLNTIGGAKWNKAGDWIEWQFTVPGDGLYQFAFDYKQNFNTSMTSFRRLEIDGQVPFDAMETLDFPFGGAWRQKVPGDQSPYRFYLTKGMHVLRLTVVNAPYRKVYNQLHDVNQALKALDLRVKEIIGYDVDIYRLWDLSQYIPTIQSDLGGYMEQLAQVVDELHAIEGDNNELGNFSAAVADLGKYARRPNDITKDADSLTNIYSVFSDWEERLNSQPLLLDKLYVKSADQRFPSPDTGFFSGAWFAIRNFAQSFASSSGTVTTSRTDCVQVWVQRNRDYVDLMQQVADEYYTKRTGVKVNISYCPPGTQLMVLANASGKQPDIVTGVDIAVPFEFGIRNALVDLSGFDGFDEVIQNVVPGSRIPYTFGGGEYAIAEEVRVNVLYFRMDVLKRLGIAVPQTWGDTTRALSTLLQNNYNLYYPYGDYLTFFFQNNVEVYTPDGLRIAFNNEDGFHAFRYWTELYTRYGMQAEMSSFYQHFRLGDVPIGITGIDQYILFDLAAPDISGLWQIALAPGTYDENGNLLRWQAGTQTGAVMFATTPERERRAWDFLKWWMDTDTQAMFADDLENYYGAEFRWFSANTAVVAQQAWNEQAKAVLLTQLDWYKQQPMVPGGSYITAREIWNAWTRTVIDKLNYREQLELTIEDIVLEMSLKQKELGYTDENGNILKEMPVMSLDAPQRR